MMSFRNKAASLVVVALAVTIGLIASGGLRTAHAQAPTPTPTPTPAALPAVLPPTGSVCLPVPEQGFDVCISLEPETASNPVGTTHTVTATVTEDDAPAEGVPVEIAVHGGPNAITFDIGFTNASGQFAFTYTGDGGPGRDDILGCVWDIEDGICIREGSDYLIDVATKDWVGPTPTPTPAPTPAPTPTPTPTATPVPTAVLAVQQLPRTGGTPSGGGSLPWLAIAAGALAITSGGLAFAYRTRRIR